MKKLLVCVLLQAMMLSASAQHQTRADLQYTRADSLRVVELLSTARQYGTKPESPMTMPDWMLYFSQQFLNIPYTAKTLETNDEEHLIVNTRQLDCTTFVETVLTLARCITEGKRTFGDYCHTLQMIRYRNGVVDYTTRLHYFTDWILDNTRLGFVKEISQPASLFSLHKQLNINFMSANSHLYPMLKGHPKRQKEIAAMEKRLTGLVCPSIPKQALTNSKELRNAIHDGDILVLTTTKAGLDVQHLGIAVWHKDGLHMINASQIHKKVVEEPMTLAQYMQKHPSQSGVRVVRALP